MPEETIINASARKFSHQVTVKVKITSEFVVRLWVAKQLLRLATWVLGANIEFVEGDHANL
jgi:hypothetical protein